MSTLYLGSCDNGKIPSNRNAFLAPYHKDGLTARAVSFRDDDRTTWRSFREGAANEVAEFQKFLHNAGFMPRGIIDGIFDYVTQAAARLFQEYVRTLDSEGDKTMVPDGIVGNITMQHVQRWKNQGIVADWGKSSTSNSSKEYNEWLKLLTASKAHYIANPGPIMQAVNAMDKTYSTIKAKDWNISSDEIHLIGLRRKENRAAPGKRANDDIFILLVNGMVFKFWGSTDPSRAMIKVSNPPFLVEGQHKYRFGWHWMNEEKKIYRALKPYESAGVIILRDLDKDHALTPNDLTIRGSRSLEVNNSINIHWSAIGTSNWSAGCQVIAGKNYINNKNQLVDCSKFASPGYNDLTSASQKTKGAYNVLADLIVCYSKAGVDHVLYTLGREESLNLDANFGADYATNAIRMMNPSGI